MTDNRHSITVRGAREHNLKNVDITIPPKKIRLQFQQDTQLKNLFLLI